MFSFHSYFLGTELVHDDSEKCLLQEVEHLRINQKKLEACLDKCKDQVKFSLNILILPDFFIYIIPNQST